MRQSLILATLFGALCLAGSSAVTQCQTTDKPAATDQSSLQLKVESNLVVVRVVVRDAQGHPVVGLNKEDFKLLDRGKEQPIGQFEEELQPENPASSAPTQPQGSPPAPAPPARAQRFIGFYFDDLNTSDADMMQARDAATSYLAANMRPTDRVAIFTSTKILSDFTSDPDQIRKALSQLRTNPVSLTRSHGCPDVSDFQAEELLHSNDVDSNAWKAVWAEARTCAVRSFATSQFLGDPVPNALSMRAIRELAQDVANHAQDQARANLEQFAQVVRFLAGAPGQRIAILVSPGFLSASDQLTVDRTIDRALRGQVTINSMNPKGLAVMMRESDASRGSALADPHALQARHALDSERAFVASDVLAEMAQGTGGDFFHDDNDLKAGFEALAGHPANYVLTFSPRDIKLDGKYHELKVTLAEKQKGFSVHARRGYFAIAEEASASQPAQPNTQPAATTVLVPPKATNPAVAGETKKSTAQSAEAQDQQKIQEALHSKTDSTALTVGLEASPSEGEGETRVLATTIHLDTRLLPLHKEGGHSINAITFAVAVFDDKDTLVQVKQRHAKVDLSDDQLPDFLSDGLDMNTLFELKPGSYRLRVAVIESSEHRLGALSRDIALP